MTDVDAGSGRSDRVLLATTTVVALAAAVVAGVGVAFRGDGTSRLVTSVRDETYEMVTTGVYAWNAQRVVAEGIGWDLFTLLVAVPILLAALVATARGSLAGRLAVLGMLGYLAYQYLEYSVTWAFGPLLVPFIALFASSLALIAAHAAKLARDPRGRNARLLDDRFPTRAWAGLSLTMGGLLALLWLGRIWQGLATGVDGLLMGETTMTVQVLDLGLVVPVLVASAILVSRGGQAGRWMAAAVGVTFAAMAGAITAMLLSAWTVEGMPELPPLALFGAATLAGVVTASRMLRSTTRAGAEDTPRTVSTSAVGRDVVSDASHQA